MEFSAQGGSHCVHSLDVVGARREEQFQRREQIIKKKDLELQENLIRFNKFLQVPLPAVPLDCYSVAAESTVAAGK